MGSLGSDKVRIAVRRFVFQASSQSRVGSAPGGVFLTGHFKGESIMDSQATREIETATGDDERDVCVHLHERPMAGLEGLSEEIRSATEAAIDPSEIIPELVETLDEQGRLIRAQLWAGRISWTCSTAGFTRYRMSVGGTGTECGRDEML